MLVGREAGDPARQLQQRADLTEREEQPEQPPGDDCPAAVGRRTAAAVSPQHQPDRGQLRQPGLDAGRRGRGPGRRRWPARSGRAARRLRPGRPRGAARMAAAAGGGGGQDLLGAAVVLVGAAPGHHGDPEAGDRDRRDRAGRRPAARPRARRCRRGSRSAGGRRRCRAGRRPPGAIAPITAPRASDADRPAQERRSVHPPGQGEHVGQPRRAMGRSGPGREQPGAEVAAGAEQLRAERRAPRRGRRTGAAPTTAGRTRRASRVFQPNGVSQLSHPAPTSPTARIR